MYSRAMAALTPEQMRQWREQGFVRLPAFAPRAVCDAMLARAVEHARAAAAGRATGETLVTPEPSTRAAARTPEEGTGKVFRLHRDGDVFESFARDASLLDLLADLIGPEVDCFLSQFIFKNPGALGQPWHQDSWYFPMEPDRQVGVWLAVTEATLENGPLWILPGSQVEPVHEHVPDARPHAQYGYVEIVDHDMSAAEPVLMEPGDLLLFDSHLMHRSTDNGSEGIRAAMVYHYSRAGTVDRSDDRIRDRIAAHRGPDAPPLPAEELDRLVSAANPNRWMPVRRADG